MKLLSREGERDRAKDSTGVSLTITKSACGLPQSYLVLTLFPSGEVVNVQYSTIQYSTVTVSKKEKKLPEKVSLGRSIFTISMII
jgi:hypothetical protein